MIAPGAELRVEDVSACYGRRRVLHDISLHVQPGSIVALLGANGAGKTTTLRALSSTVERTGTVLLDGVSVEGVAPETLVRRGLAHVPEGRGTFPRLTVTENLRVGGARRPARELAQEMTLWFETFPRLWERRTQRAGDLSGGEQQMLAIARAMMSGPRILLLDEPSMGLAPKVTASLFTMLAEINSTLGTSMLIVEQNANLALEVADHAFVLESGRIVLDGAASELRRDARVRQAYLQV